MAQTFDNLIESLHSQHMRRRIAVACPHDDHTLHVVLRSLSEGIADFVLVVDEAHEFVAENVVSAIIYTVGEYVDYYISAQEFHNSTEIVLRNIRIDPSNVPDVKSEIVAVELIKKKADKDAFEVVVDGEQLPVPFYCKSRQDGEYYVAANPRHGVFSATNIYHLWNRFEGTLYIKTSTGVEFNFKIDSDICYVDGKEEKLKKPFYTFDHVPVLPLIFVLDKAGIKYELKDGLVEITIR